MTIKSITAGYLGDQIVIEVARESTTPTTHKISQGQAGQLIQDLEKALQNLNREKE
ncbi:MAG: hypothetical protein OXE84_07095 [Rhodobacteraceae bacterium]|nr:hypothetical protein [Paracoccaceae bacterium]